MRSKLVRVLFCVFLSIIMIGCGNAGNIETATEESEKETTDEAAVNSSNALVSKTNEELAGQYGATTIILDDSQILVDGSAISTDSTSAVYAANDIVFYLEGQDFTYGEGTREDEHSQEEADAHTVVHITQPGSYVISGKLSAGQIAVDLGAAAKKDEEAVVTLILNNVDITCSVAPGIIFYNVYECGSDEVEGSSKDVDTSKAGANVIIADGSVNQVNGSYVARIYESVELNEDGTEVVDSKKLHKYDAAIYSKCSMNINGETENTGVLNIKAENEGLDSELHLTINGGNINITSGNDGINTNEDEVSVTTINGGSLNIVVDGATGEGDGIDSNGWLVINGGSVTAAACSFSGDAGIDSDMGIYINGGTVLATGNMLDAIADSAQNYVVFTFDAAQAGGSSYELKNADGSVIGNWTPVNDFSMLVFSGESLTAGNYTLWKDGTQLSVQESGKGMMGGRGPMMGGERPEMPEGEIPTMPEGEIPMGKNRPEMSEETTYVPEGNPMMRPDGEWTDLDEMPEGEHPQMQEGEMPEMPTDGELVDMPQDDGRGQYKGGGAGVMGEVITEFEIVDGGNMYTVVTVQ